MPLKSENVTFSGHAVRRMFERAISMDDVRQALAQGEVIESYPDDTPLPSFLVLDTASGRPLHVVVAYEQSTPTCHVITVYIPNNERWQADNRTRRPR